MTKTVLLIHEDADALAGMLDVPADVRVVAFDQEKASTNLMPAAQAIFPDADAILSIGRWLTPSMLATAPSLKWVQCLITGVDHLLPVLSGSDIVLTNARGIHGPQMAELAILHMMWGYRQVPRLLRNQMAHVWDRFRPRVLANRTVVILGIGAIAEHTAQVCKALGMRTVGVTSRPRDQVVGRENMMEAVKEADFLLVLLPMSAENRGIVNADMFKVMKNSAYLINLARGGIVDENALVEALASKEIAGAGLDVFATSPLPETSPLWDLENVFITPWVGGQSDQYAQDLAPILNKNLAVFAKGDMSALTNVIAM